MLNCKLGLQVSVKHWVILNSLHDLETQKAVIFELELVYRPDVYEGYCSILLSKVRGNGILFIFTFALLDSSFYEHSKETLKPKLPWYFEIICQSTNRTD